MISVGMLTREHEPKVPSALASSSPLAGSRGAHQELVQENEATFPDADPSHLHHLVVLGHPASDSFNHAIAREYCDAVRACGQVPVLRDLYGLGFDPLLKAHERPGAADFALSPDVERELTLIYRCSAVTMIYPIWFGMPPAIITGYVDRVLGAGLTPKAIREGQRHDTLFNKQLVLITTSGSTKPWLAERGQWHGLREAFDFYLESIFSFADCQHEHFDTIVSPLLPDYAQECLGRVAQQARQTCSTVLSTAHERQKRLKLGLWRQAHRVA